MNRFGGKIPGAIEGKQITALEKDEIFKRFAALQLPKDACKQRPQGFRGNGIEHLSHVADLPSQFWRNASNFRGLFESLPHYVATIKIAYSEIYLDINVLL